MRILICGRVLLVSALILVGTGGWTQESHRSLQPAPDSTDLAITFGGERSKPDPSSCCFWFKAGGVDAAVTFWKGLGIVATLTGDHASNVFLGRDENKISFLAGPRYTLTAWKGRAGVSDPQRLQLFGQGLVGVAHVFAGSSTSANELGVQAGGGANLYLTKKFGIRPIEAYLVRTQRGPDGYNTQNDIQLAAAVFYHFDVTLSFKAGIPPPVTLRCSANPTAVFRGDPPLSCKTRGSGGIGAKMATKATKRN